MRCGPSYASFREEAGKDGHRLYSPILSPASYFLLPLSLEGLMENRWSDEVARGLDPLQLLVYRSNLLGADPTVVNRGGGNTSIKRQITDFRGQPVDVLTVKATGYDLRTIGPAGFCDVR